MNGFVLCDNYLSWVPFLMWDFSFLFIIVVHRKWYRIEKGRGNTSKQVFIYVM